MVEALLLMLVRARSPAAADPERRVRGTEKRTEELIVREPEKSSTFRALVAALNATDLIVSVEPRVNRVGLGGYRKSGAYETRAPIPVGNRVRDELRRAPAVPMSPVPALVDQLVGTD